MPLLLYMQIKEESASPVAISNLSFDTKSYLSHILISHLIKLFFRRKSPLKSQKRKAGYPDNGATYGLCKT